MCFLRLPLFLHTFSSFSSYFRFSPLFINDKSSPFFIHCPSFLFVLCINFIFFPSLLPSPLLIHKINWINLLQLLSFRKERHGAKNFDFNILSLVKRNKLMIKSNDFINCICSNALTFGAVFIEEREKKKRIIILSRGT